MEPYTNPTTSFIPKKSLQDSFENKKQDYVKKRSVLGLGFYIILAIFLITVFMAGGLFLYAKTLVADIKRQEAGLKTLHDQFDQEMVQELIRSDTRLRNVTSLIKSHVAPSNIFAEIEKTALKEIYLEKLNYRGLLSGGSMEVAMTGIAPTFDAVAQQVGQFEAHESFSSPTITQLEFTDDKQLRFGLVVEMHPDLVLYSQ